MDRRTRRDRDRSTAAFALLLSLAAHVALFAWVRIDGPGPEAPATQRVAEVEDVRDAWAERPLEVVRVRVATAEAADEASRAVVRAPGAVALRFRPPQPTLPKASLATTPSVRPAPAPALHSLALRREEAESRGGAALGDGTSAGAAARSGARRGVVLRGPIEGTDAHSGWDFTAASEAAREAERRRGDEEGTGARGPGLPVFGDGEGRCPTPPTGGAIPRRPPTRGG